jgi:hypothetical protein
LIRRTLTVTTAPILSSRNTWFTFLPFFVFILAGGPLVESTHGELRYTAPLTAITAAIVGRRLSAVMPPASLRRHSPSRSDDRLANPPAARCGHSPRSKPGPAGRFGRQPMDHPGLRERPPPGGLAQRIPNDCARSEFWLLSGGVPTIESGHIARSQGYPKNYPDLHRPSAMVLRPARCIAEISALVTYW